MFFGVSIEHSLNFRGIGQSWGQWQQFYREFWELTVTGMVKIENDSDRNGLKWFLGCQQWLPKVWEELSHLDRKKDNLLTKFDRQQKPELPK